MINCIIICAGDASRWNNYLNVPKHLIEIEGEPLIHKTVRLIHKYKKEKVNVNIVVKDFSDNRYECEGAELYKAKLDSKNLDADKFFSSKELWNREGRTIVFYGDVFFTDEAMKSIMEHEGKDWILFCRSKKSELTGCGWGECFAQSFYTKDIDKHKENLYKTIQAFKDKHITCCGGWNHYRSMVGFSGPDLEKKVFNGSYYDIDDFTEDFDFHKDYDDWFENREKYKGEKQ